MEETLNALLDAESGGRRGAREKAIRVITKLRGLRLTRAAELAEAGVDVTLTGGTGGTERH